MIGRHRHRSTSFVRAWTDGGTSLVRAWTDGGTSFVLWFYCSETAWTNGLILGAEGRSPQ